jgi:hypothetical protein
MRIWLIADQILIYLQGFGDHLASNNRPVIGNMFKQSLDIILQVVPSFPKNKVLRSKVCGLDLQP